MHAVDNTPQCQDAFFISPRRYQEWRPSSKSQAEKNEVKILSSVAPLLMFDKHIVRGADFWQNRGFNDKSAKTSKIVHLDLLIKIGHGPIA